MQNIEALCGEILALGAQKAGGIAVGEIPFHAELRRACEQNFCGAYGKNYMCPPHCGDVETLIERARTYRSMILFQRVYPTEDSFDIESMQAGARAFKEIVRNVGAYARTLDTDTLVLGNGGCDLCEECAVVRGEPCLHPEQTYSSLEAYGIEVSRVAPLCGMRYINGVNTVTYFGALFVR